MSFAADAVQDNDTCLLPNLAAVTDVAAAGAVASLVSTDDVPLVEETFASVTDVTEYV